MIERTVTASVHGRYLLEERSAERVLVGFHGYAETAESCLEEMLRIPGLDRWSLVSVQALHPFYTRAGTVVASWMTRLQRDHAIDDNVAYVQRVIEDLPPAQTLVFIGFSQGAPMAARAATRAARSAGLILLGGELPPEIFGDPHVQMPPTLLARGSRDEWYTDEKFKHDLNWLESRTRVARCVFAGGHEWSDAFREAAGEFLQSLE